MPTYATVEIFVKRRSVRQRRKKIDKLDAMNMVDNHPAPRSAGCGGTQAILKALALRGSVRSRNACLGLGVRHTLSYECEKQYAHVDLRLTLSRVARRHAPIACIDAFLSSLARLYFSRPSAPLLAPPLPSPSVWLSCSVRRSKSDLVDYSL